MRGNRTVLVHQKVSTGLSNGFIVADRSHSVMNRKTTVPFKRELVGGFALNGKKFLPEQPGQPVDAYGTDSIKKKEALRDPCDTCGLLITHPSLNFPPSNFKINF